MDTNTIQTDALNTPIPLRLRNHHRSWYPNLKTGRTNPFGQGGLSENTFFRKTNPFAHCSEKGTTSGRLPPTKP